MSNVPLGLTDNVKMESNQSSARRYYSGSSAPSRRHHVDTSCSEASYLERPLLQSSAQATPSCRRHYDACQSETHWNSRDGPRATVVHRVKAPIITAIQTAPPTVNSVLDQKQPNSSAVAAAFGAFGSCASMRVRSQAQMVDVMSRILFPCMFLVFNIIYWPYYLFFSAP